MKDREVSMGTILGRVNSREEKQTIKKENVFLIVQKGRYYRVRGASKK
jgi:hypothetical protein